MGICCVYGCFNRTDRKRKKGVSFHRFPKDELLKKRWIVAVRRSNWKPGPNTFVCSEHFEDNLLNRTFASGYTELRENAVPTIFPSYPLHLQPSNKKIRKPPRTRETTASVFEPVECNSEESMEVAEVSTKEVAVQVDDTSLITEMSELTNITKNLKWKVNDLTRKLNSKSKAIKKLRIKTNRLNVRISSMKSLIQQLKSKNLIDNECALQIENMTGLHKELFLANPNKTKNFSSSLKAFALTLDFYSPKAYRYIRETFNSCLPHPRTLARWYSTVNASPGFCLEALNALKDRSNESIPIICSLVVDEMAIRKKVEWDGNRCMGYVDIGQGVDSERVAKDAYVFLLVAINANWRLPLGYFLVDGINGEQRSLLVLRCLHLLYEKHVNVVSLTFDGTISNISMANYLGCDISKTKLQTHFINPETNSNVHVILDPCHMIKLVRNTLGEYQFFYDIDGKLISWDLILELHSLQSEEGLHLGNKLRKSHVQYHLQKMKVRLATQTLSCSVADAIQWCHENGIPGFDDVEGTVRFIRTFNRLFDILNSRSINQKFDKAPMQQSNIVGIRNFLEDTDNYIANLKDRNNKLVCEGQRWTGFVGFRVCIKSVLNLYTELIDIEAPVLKYLPTYKLSQDNIEILFGYIRSKFGCNNNPTAKQFIAAFRKILIHKKIHCPQGANCVALEEMTILNKSSTNAIEVINASTSPLEYSTFAPCVVDEHNYSLQFTFNGLSLFAKEVVGYISGFVVQRIEQKIKCIVCLSALRDDERMQASLISTKNRGGLIFPSKDVVTICNLVETIIRRLIHVSGLHNFNKNVTSNICTQVLSSLSINRIFKSLENHSFDQSFENNHMFHLIKIICEMYIKIRLHHSTKMFTEQLHSKNVRQHNLKTTLFLGQ